MREKNKILVGISCMVFLAVLIGFVFSTPANGRNHHSSEYSDFRIFSSAFQQIRAYYHDEKKVDAKNLVYGAIDGMLHALGDEHSNFLRPKFLKNLKEDTSGEFGGLGIMIGMRDKILTIISPIYGTPAWKKHLAPGDKIIKIDGKSTKDITLRKAVQKLRGKVGSYVNITLTRENFDRVIKVKIKRALIKIETVKSEYIKKYDLQYIKLTQFSGNTASLLRKLLLKVRKNKQLKGIVLDLRFNPGGLLSSAINITDMFISKGIIVYTKGRHASQTRYYLADSESTVVPKDIPMVILINKGSASASEIVSGALQDTKRGYLLGENSYGKGSVQTIIPFFDGSAMKLTIALYYTPSGKQINKIGLQPDFEIKIPAYSKNEQFSVSKLISGNYLRDFLRKKPKYSYNDIKNFSKALRSKEYINLSVKELDRWLYWEKNKIGKPELINLKYDLQLRKAVEMFKAGKFKSRKVKSFLEEE